MLCTGGARSPPNRGRSCPPTVCRSRAHCVQTVVNYTHRKGQKIPRTSPAFHPSAVRNTPRLRAGGGRRNAAPRIIVQRRAKRGRLHTTMKNAAKSHAAKATRKFQQKKVCVPILQIKTPHRASYAVIFSLHHCKHPKYAKKHARQTPQTNSAPKLPAPKLENYCARNKEKLENKKQINKAIPPACKFSRKFRPRKTSKNSKLKNEKCTTKFRQLPI